MTIKLLSSITIFLFLSASIFVNISAVSVNDTQCMWIEYDSQSFSCTFSNYVDLENKLMHLEFFSPSNINDDFIFSLVDSEGNMISSSPIMDWYQVSTSTTANISIDPKDLLKQGQFLFDEVNEIRLFFPHSDNPKLPIKNFHIGDISKYDNFALNNFLPIQSILPGFLFLIILSFPIGYLLLNKLSSFQNHNIIERFPLILGIGFLVYVIFLYVTSTFFISYETVIGYLVISYILFFYYVYKRKLCDFDLSSLNFSSLFFLGLIIFSSVFVVYFIGYTGWPVDPNDGLNHGIMTSFMVENNQRWDGTNWEPIRDLRSDNWSLYPTGLHVSSASITLLLGSFPATSLSTVFAFSTFLLITLFTLFVYKITHSVFFSILFYVLLLIRPDLESFWYGDLFWNNWLGGLLSSEVGITAFFLLFMALFDGYQNKSKKSSIILLSLILTSIFIIYIGFFAIGFIIIIVWSILYLIKNKSKKIIFLSSLFLFTTIIPYLIKKFLFVQFEKDFIRNFVSPSSHYKLLNLQPFDFTPLSYLWISVYVSIISSLILFREKNYRYFLIPYLILTTISILSISPFFFYEMFFYHATLRSIPLVFFPSIAINLIFVHWISSKYKLKEKIKILHSKNKIILYGPKVFVLILIVTFLFPTFLTYFSDITSPSRLVKVPGGNEHNLHLWLYENTNSTDLVLNDHAWASLWYLGTKGQSIINSNYDYLQIARTYNPQTDKFEPSEERLQNIVNANFILKNPWDYDYISKTVKKLDIKYVYISERTSPHQLGCGYKCYPDSKEWSWKNYSGNARIGMYENHPNLELVIRNGHSAVFKVINP